MSQGKLKSVESRGEYSFYIMTALIGRTARGLSIYFNDFGGEWNDYGKSQLIVYQKKKRLDVFSVIHFL